MRGLISHKRHAIWMLCGVIGLGLLPLASAEAAFREQDKQMIREVLGRLFAVATPPEGYAWPPKVFLEDNSAINACAYNSSQDSSRVVPAIDVYSGLMDKIVQGHPERLAFVVGHEIGHILRGHIVHKARDPKHGTMFLHNTFTREQELEADQLGMQLCLRANYAFAECVGGMKVFVDNGLDYSAFRGQELDHPSWKERLALIDKNRAGLWLAMAAFHSGTDLLAFEQFAAAAECFAKVASDFPECSEAWANLGYARLMLWCDALKTDDLRKLGITQMVVGGFYERPEWLRQALRGGNEKDWSAAVEAFNKALSLNPKLTLVKANLGIAYLVAPGGKDVSRAMKYLREAAQAIGTDQNLSPSMHASILINTGVAEIAGGEDELAMQRFDKAASLQNRAAGPRQSSSVAASCALLYNRAVLLSDSVNRANRTEAARDFLDYFRAASPGSAWWPLAYERYAKTCRDLGIQPAPEDQLRQTARAAKRQITGIDIGPGQLMLGQDWAAAQKVIKDAGLAMSLIPGTKLQRIIYPLQGIQVIGLDRVLAISLSGAAAPAVMVRGAELGSEPQAVRIGMPLDEFDKIVGNQRISFEPFVEPGVRYAVYRDLQLAIRAQNGRIIEIVVAMIPEEPRQEKQ